MRGCAFSLLLGLLGLALTIGAVGFLFHQLAGFPGPQAAVAGAVVGGLVWMALHFFRVALRSWREQRAVAAGLAGDAPVDGETAVLVGKLEPLGETLKAPLDGSECVAYSYQITQDIGQGKSRRHLTHYRGVGLAPSVLRTPAGSYGLMAVPDFEGPHQLLSKGESIEAAERYVEATAFRPSGGGAANELTERWNDADGEYRSDVSTVQDAKPNLLLCMFQQHRVAPGEQICLIGTYSASRNGIVPHANWGKRTRLIVGDPAQAGATLGSQVKTRTILGLLFAAAAAFAAWRFLAESA